MRHRLRRLIVALVIFAAVHFGNVAPAQSVDWPQWRGPNRDGVVRGVTVPEQWPTSLEEEWKVPVGEGASSPVVVSGKIFLLTRQKENEECALCVELCGGKQIWRAPYAAPYQLGGPAHGFEGPRSTPAVANGRVFTFGISGILSCLDTKNGKVLWRKDFTDEDRETAPGWGTSASPLVHENLCFLHVGGPNQGHLSAFDTATGQLKWRSVDDGPGYGSPILAELAGELQVVTLTLNHFAGFSAATGKLLWKLPSREIHSENCVTPVLYKDLLIFAGRKEPPRAIRLEKNASGITPVEVWKGDGPTLYMSTPVLAGDLLFGLSDRKSGRLFCLDAGTGKTLWEDERRLESSAAILNAGSAWLALTTRGELIVVRPGGTAFQQIASYQVSDTPVWAHPVFLGNRILIKDRDTLRSLRIAPVPQKKNLRDNAGRLPPTQAK